MEASGVVALLARRRGREPAKRAGLPSAVATLLGEEQKIVYVRDPRPDSVFVITAYELRGRPLLAYRRRQRRKQR